MVSLTPFHLAIPVINLSDSIHFYEHKLGCKPGRSTKEWADYSLFGHQLVLHEDKNHKSQNHFNEVDGKSVPIPHFGVILEWDQFQKFSTNLVEKNISFIIDPYIRFKGLPGEQATMFFTDPCGNALEFKSFKDFNQIFAK